MAMALLPTRRPHPVKVLKYWRQPHGDGLTPRSSYTLHPPATQACLGDGSNCTSWLYVNGLQSSEVFNDWVVHNTPVLSPPEGLIRPVYLPFWVFEADVRIFVDGVLAQQGNRGPNDAALQVYGGHSYRRSMTQVLKSPLLGVRPFSADMLDVGLPVDIVEMGVFETTAIVLVKAALVSEFTAMEPGVEASSVSVELKRPTSRRVMMPGYVTEYPAFGTSFRAFINGATGAAYGLQQSVFPAPLVATLRRHALSLAPVLPLFLRALAYPPVVALSAVGAAVMLASRRYHEWALLRARRQSYEAWDRERASERAAQRAMEDTWYYAPPASRAQADQARATAEGWAQYCANSRRRGSGHKVPPRPPQPHAGESHYDVLGLGSKGRTATKQDIKAAFRRQLMTYHPDRAASNGIDPDTATARTRQIYDAYAVLRDPNKRAAYDRSR